MSKDNEWGVGDPEKFKPFERVVVEDRVLELGHGEHPHSRSYDSFYVRNPRDTNSFESFSGHRRPWHIEIIESNYLKESHLSGNDVRGSCRCEISWMLPPGGADLKPDGVFSASTGAIKKPVYSFSAREAIYVIQRLPELLLKLGEFPVDLWKGGVGKFPDLVGRPIFYENTPAVVKDYWPDQGAVYIEAVDKPFPRPVWMDDDDLDDDCHGQRRKDDLFSSRIYWFRK